MVNGSEGAPVTGQPTPPAPLKTSLTLLPRPQHSSPRADPTQAKEDTAPAKSQQPSEQPRAADRAASSQRVNTRPVTFTAARGPCTQELPPLAHAPSDGRRSGQGSGHHHASSRG